MKTLLLLLTTLTFTITAQASNCYANGWVQSDYYTTISRVTRPDGSEALKVNNRALNSQPTNLRVIHTIEGPGAPSPFSTYLPWGDPRREITEFYTYFEGLFAIPACTSQYTAVKVEVYTTLVSNPASMTYSIFTVHRKK